jgi:hypothetical protein
VPNLFNPLQRNEFGFYRGTNGEVDESKAADAPSRETFARRPQTFLSDLTSSFQNGRNSHGGFSSLGQFLSGQGALSVSQPIFKEKEEIGKEQFSISPGGGFNLQKFDMKNQPIGFGVTGNPTTKSLGVDFPVGNGRVGLEGSFNSFDPYVKANFAFKGNKQPVVDNSEQQLNAALGLNQRYDQDKQIYTEPYTAPEPSARDFLNQKIEEYRSSGGRDPNSPSSWR